MNRIVREHYPVSQLPEELRPSDDPNIKVTVIVEEEERPEKIMSLEEIFAARRPPFRTAEEIDRDLRQQRDEWDD
jgi:hypothetical protein